MSSIEDVVGRFQAYIVGPTIVVVFAAGFFFFVFGLVEFLIKLNSGEDTKDGKQHMLWGIIGMVIMASAYSILALATGTFGIDINASPDTSNLNGINIGGSLD